MIISFDKKTKIKILKENPNLIVLTIFIVAFPFLIIFINKLQTYLIFGIFTIIGFIYIYYAYIDTLTMIRYLEIDKEVIKIEIIKKNRISKKLEFEISKIDLKFTEIHLYRQSLIRLDCIENK
jgi:hypothetical protein